MPENEESPNSPSFTVPAISSPSTVPVNSRVIGIGSVINTFQEIVAIDSTVENFGRISVGHLTALEGGAFCLHRKGSLTLTHRRGHYEVPVSVCGQRSSKPRQPIIRGTLAEVVRSTTYADWHVNLAGPL